LIPEHGEVGDKHDYSIDIGSYVFGFYEFRNVSVISLEYFTLPLLIEAAVFLKKEGKMPAK
jgi:hypothetical protein